MTTVTTIKEWLESVAASTISTEQDSTRMQNLLRRVGFPNSIVTMGIVYPEGRGTIEYPPMSIQFIAKVLLEKEKGR